jgi:hypothetical protein
MCSRYNEESIHYLQRTSINNIIQVLHNDAILVLECIRHYHPNTFQKLDYPKKSTAIDSEFVDICVAEVVVLIAGRLGVNVATLGRWRGFRAIVIICNRICNLCLALVNFVAVAFDYAFCQRCTLRLCKTIIFKNFGTLVVEQMTVLPLELASPTWHRLHCQRNIVLVHAGFLVGYLLKNFGKTHSKPRKPIACIDPCLQ